MKSLAFLKQLPEGWQAAAYRDVSIDPAIISNPGARGEDAPLAVLA